MLSLIDRPFQPLYTTGVVSERLRELAGPIQKQLLDEAAVLQREA